MSPTKQTVERTGSEGGLKHTKLSGRNSPSSGGKQDEDLVDFNRFRRPKLDFDDDEVKPQWEKIIDRKREELETEMLQITEPRAKLDQIARQVLDGLLAKLICPDERGKEGGGGSSVMLKTLEKHVRTFIFEKGIASEVKKVTLRLNARRMTDGRRWVLSKTYVWLLNNLFQDKSVKQDKNSKIDTLVQDDLGVAERIMLDLEAKKGPIDIFAQLLVKAVMERNRIGESETLLQLVAQQVRSTI